MDRFRNLGSWIAPLALVASLAGNTVAQPRQRRHPLLEELARIAAASKGTVGVSAIDIATGQVTAFNADERFKMASTFKVPVARREDMIEPGVLFEHFRHPGAAHRD